ncbi:MAG: hypothetical protein ACP5XB_13400 [Isosphaeraceae bacterium]
MSQSAGCVENWFLPILGCREARPDLSDLAVDRDYQRGGIGKELIRRTHETAGPRTMLILLAAPLDCSYYPHVGMASYDSTWIIARQRPGG